MQRGMSLTSQQYRDNRGMLLRWVRHFWDDTLKTAEEPISGRRQVSIIPHPATSQVWPHPTASIEGRFFGARKIPLLLKERPRNVDGALPLDATVTTERKLTHYLCDRVFWQNADRSVDIVMHEVPFHNPALVLYVWPVPRMPHPDISVFFVQCFSSKSRNPYHMVLLANQPTAHRGTIRDLPGGPSNRTERSVTPRSPLLFCVGRSAEILAPVVFLFAFTDNWRILNEHTISKAGIFFTYGNDKSDHSIYCARDESHHGRAHRYYQPKCKKTTITNIRK